MAERIETLISAGWVIPVEPENTVLTNHSIAINGGVIQAVIPHGEAIKRFEAQEHIQLPNHVLFPGFINCHTHAAMSLLRGMADDLPLMDWLQHHIWPVEGEFIDDEFVKDGVNLAMLEMLRSGTTCFNDMYFMPNATAQAAIEAGMRANIGLIIIDFPSAWAQNADEYLRKGLSLFDDNKHHPLLSFSFAPHAPYTVSDSPLQKIATYSNELGLSVHMHVHETAFEVDEATQKTGERPLTRLNRLGLLNPQLQAVHMTQLNEQEIELVAQHGVHVLHCPQSNMKLASGIAPISRLHAAGVNLAIGTDGAASNNDLDMLNETQTAALLAKVSSHAADAFPAHAALTAATLGGAKALGIDDKTGSLVEGKSADIVALDLNTPETQPVYDAISQVVYSAARHQISDVWVNGRQLLKDRVTTTLNEELIVEKARDWGARIQAWRQNQSS